MFSLQLFLDDSKEDGENDREEYEDPEVEGEDRNRHFELWKEVIDISDDTEASVGDNIEEVSEY